MKVKKITFKKRFTRKVSSLAMAFMMVANLLGGYCAASEVSTKKSQRSNYETDTGSLP